MRQGDQGTVELVRRGPPLRVAERGRGFSRIGRGSRSGARWPGCHADADIGGCGGYRGEDEEEGRHNGDEYVGYPSLHHAGLALQLLRAVPRKQVFPDTPHLGVFLSLTRVSSEVVFRVGEGEGSPRPAARFSSIWQKFDPTRQALTTPSPST